MGSHRRHHGRHPARRPGGGLARWFRGRPFGGGLLVVLSGAAILLAPLAPLPLVVQQGIAGVSGYVVGVLLVALGALSWLQPAQHVFFGVTAVLLSLASFVTSNFGGFGVGMLLGLVGGCLLASWIPGAGRPLTAVRPVPGARSRAEPPARGRGG